MRAMSFRLTAGLVCGALLVCSTTAVAANSVITFTTSRSSVPANNLYEITLKVDACGASSATVTGDGSTIPSSMVNGNVVFTTQATSTVVTLVNPTNTANLGKYTKASLRDDKKWALSIGFDDNTMLAGMIDAMNAAGYQGTLFVIGSSVSLTRDERSWIVDAPQMRDLVPLGWAIGNHTWTHAYASSVNAQQDILKDQDIIHQCLQSIAPNYKVTGFAAPMFDDAYQPVIISMRDSKTGEALFNTSKEAYKIQVDAGTQSTSAGWNKFTFDLEIGRDINLETGLSAIQSTIDFMHINANDTHHYWYNLLAHGSHDSQVQATCQYLKNNYASEVWCAPAERIYAYLEMREKATITVAINGVTAIGEPITGCRGTGVDGFAVMNRRFKVTPSGQPRSVYSLAGDFCAHIEAGASWTASSSGSFIIQQPNGQSFLVVVR